MTDWFTEYHTPNAGFTLKIKKRLYHGKTPYQKIDVFENEDYGKVLILDDLIMITEKDEYVYHEMMTHLSVFTHKNPRKALVIGGGDGGTIRELCKHPGIEHIDQAEIDEVVIDISRRFFPKVASAYDNPKVHLHITDGYKFVEKHHHEYDLIIIDSSEPIGPGKILFGTQFYKYVLNALHPRGIMTAQIGTPFYKPKQVKETFRRLRRVFPIVRPFLAHVPTYADGFWCFAFCSDYYDPLRHFDAQRFESLQLKCKYYNPDVHRGAFLLPEYVARLVAG